MIYNSRDMYPVESFLNFYNSFAKTVITYGLNVYISATKTNWKKMKKLKRLIESDIFKSKLESVGPILENNDLLTVFEPSIVLCLSGEVRKAAEAHFLSWLNVF